MLKKRILVATLFALLLVVMLTIFVFVLVVAVESPQRLQILSSQLDNLLFPTMAILFTAIAILFIILILTLVGYLEKSPVIIMPESKTEKISKGDIATMDGWLLSDSALCKLLEAAKRGNREKLDDNVG